MSTFVDASTRTWRDVGTSESFLGVTQTGLRMWEYFRPSVIEFPEQLSALQASNGDPDQAIPLSQGWWPAMAGKADVFFETISLSIVSKRG